MTKKWTTTLSLVMIAILVVFAFGLVMMATPAVQSADAEINLYASQSSGSGEFFIYLDEGQSQDVDYWLNFSDFNVQITDKASSELYHFDAAASDVRSANPDFAYPLGTGSFGFSDGTLWDITVYEDDLATPLATQPDFNAYWASVNEDGSLGEYLDTAPDKIGAYNVVLCLFDYDDEVSKASPRAYATVWLYEEAGPFKWYVNEIPYGYYGSSEYGSAILEGAFHNSNPSICSLATDYTDLKSGDHLTGMLYSVDGEGDTIDSWGRRVNNNTDKAEWYHYGEKLPVGSYKLRLSWEETYDPDKEEYIYDAGSYDFYFDIVPLEVNEAYYYGDFHRTWGGYDISQPVELLALDNVELAWYYRDYDLGEDVRLPSGLDIIPGNYEVWPVLEGADADAGYVVLGTIEVNGYAISEAGDHADLVYYPIYLDYSFSDSDFEPTYGDAGSYKFMDYAYTNLNNKKDAVNSVWGSGAVKAELRWYYLDDEENKITIDAWTDAGEYDIYCEVVGVKVSEEETVSHAYGFEIDYAIGVEALSFPKTITIARPHVSDATIYLVNQAEEALKMYSSYSPDPLDYNTLYCHPDGFEWKVQSMMNPAVHLTFDGWIKGFFVTEDTTVQADKTYYEKDGGGSYVLAELNVGDPISGTYYEFSDVVVDDISERVGETFYAINFRAVKEVDGEWVNDPNYVVDPISCVVNVERRLIMVQPSMDTITYNGEEQKPGFTIIGIDGHVNPGEGSAMSFTVQNAWDIVGEAANLDNLGTDAGIDYEYGLQVLNSDKYVFYYMGDGEMSATNHLAYTWTYNIEAASPTITFDMIEDWFYSESIDVVGENDDEKLDSFLSYLTKKFTINIETLAIGDSDEDDKDDNAVEIYYVQWNNGIDEYWYSYKDAYHPFDQYVTSYIGQTISFQFVTDASTSGNYQSWSETVQLTVAKAPIYFIYHEEDVNLPASTLNTQAVAWYEWTAVLFDRLSGVMVETKALFTTDYDMNDEVNHDDFFKVESGSNGAIWAGAHQFTIGISDAAYSMIDDYYEIANPEVTFYIDWNIITVEKFELPDVTYGDMDGTTPVIDYQASSNWSLTTDETFQEGTTYYTEDSGTYPVASVTIGDPISPGTYYVIDTSDDSEIIGAANGFGFAGSSFKTPIESWEFRMSEDAEWTTWNTMNYPKDAGIYYVRYSAYFNANGTEGHAYFKLDPVYTTFTIDPMEIELLWSGYNYTYDAIPHRANINASLAYGENVLEKVSGYDAEYTDAGEYPLTVNVMDNERGTKNYTIVGGSDEKTLVINKREVVVQAQDCGITYGDAYPTLTYVIEGLAYPETEESLRDSGYLTGAPALSVEYVRYESGVNTYAIVCENDDLVAANYEFKFEGATLTVSKAELNTPAIYQNDTRVYTGTALTSQGVVAFNYGTFSGESEDLVYTYSKTESDYTPMLPSWTNVGTYVVYYQITSGNYETVTGSYEFEISNATITGSIATKAASYTYTSYDIGTGTQIEDSLALTHTNDVFASKMYNTNGGDIYNLTERPTFVDAGTYTVYYKITAANHNDLYGSYTVVIDPKPVTVTFTVSELTKTYDKVELDPDGVGIVNGVVEGQSLTTSFGGGSKITAGTYTGVPFTLEAGENTKRGNYTLQAVGDPYGNVVNGEYSVSSQTGYVNVRIDRVVVSIDQYIDSTKANAVVYDGSIKVFSLEITNIVGNDDVSARLDNAAEQQQTAKGSYNYTVSLVGGAASNYVLDESDESVTFEITSKIITVSFDHSNLLDTSFVYGDQNVLDAISFADFYNYLTLSEALDGGEQLNEVITLSFKKGGVTTALTATSGVGKYYLVAAKKDGVTNYTFTFAINDDANAYIEVLQKELTINWAILSNGNMHTELTDEGEENLFDLVYNRTAQKPAAELVGLVGDDTAEIVWAAGSTSVNVYVGSNPTDAYKKAVISGISGNDNYKLAANAETYHYFMIVPRTIGIDWTNLEFTYDGEEHLPTATATNVCDGDSVAITVIGKQVNANDTAYTATASAVSSTNYQLPQITAQSYYINQREVNVASWGNLNPTYNGQAQVPVYALTNIVEGDEVAIVFEEDFINRGEYTYTPANMSLNDTNYKFNDTESVTMNIQRRELQISWRIDGNAVSAVTYDRLQHAVTAVVETGVAGETVTPDLRGTTAAITWREQGYTTLYFVSTHHADGTEVDNYFVAENTPNRQFDWTIEKREISLNWVLEANGEYEMLGFGGKDYKTFTFIYNGTAQHPVAELVNVAGDNLSIVYPEGIVNAITNGGYHGYEIASFEGDGAANYVWAADTEKKVFFDLQAKPITVTYTGEAKSFVYGDEDAVIALGLEMATNNWYLAAEGYDGDIFALVSSKMTNANGAEVNVNQELAAGVYTLVATDLGAAAHPNYSVTIALGDKATLTVTPATLDKVSVEQVGTLTYNGADQTAAVNTAATAVNDMDVVFTYSADGQTYGDAVPAFKAAGDYTVFYIASAANHESFGGSFTVTIAKKAITITIADKTSVYGSAPAALTADESQIVAGDKGIYTLACSVTNRTAVGEYAITGTSNAANYAVTFVNGTYTVTPKAITVKADDKTSDYKAAIVALTADDAAVEGNDDVYSLSTDANKNAVGTYKIIVTSKNNPNYILTAVDGVYTVKPVKAADGSAVAGQVVTAEEAASKEGVSITNALNGAKDGDASYEVEIGDGVKVTFDNAAVKKILENANGADVKFSYSETKKEDVDAGNKALKGAELVIDISLEGAKLEGGKVTITADFENKAPGGKVAKVYYVDENGKKVDMKATFADGKVTFETDHFSTYMVKYVLSGGAIAGIVIACVVGVAGIAVAVFFFLKKKKGPKAAAPATEEKAEEEAPKAEEEAPKAE